ncbi:hypothetical protein RB595_001915 [Gaeumannomyces hyphopodioides]
MPCLSQAFVVLAALSAAVANPVVGRQLDGGGFTLHQVAKPARRGLAPVQSGPWSVYMTHLRYGADVPAELAAAVEGGRGSSGSLARRQGKNQGTAYSPNSRNDTEWLTPIQIGSPPQTVHVQMDSGSAEFWVYADGVKAGNHSLYHPAKSTTANLIPGLSWAKSYAGGDSASGGAAYTDVVQVADGVVVQDQAVLPATNATPNFVTSPYDGIMGLSLDPFDATRPANATRPKNFFQAIKLSLPEPIYAADLKRGRAGLFDFGFAPPGRYGGDVLWVPVNQFPVRGEAYTRWNITLAGYAVGGESPLAFKERRFDTVIDTGTTIMYLDEAVVRELYARVPGARVDAPSGGWVFPCDAAVPDLSLAVDDGVDGAMARVVTIPGGYVNFSVNDAARNECFGAVQESLSSQGQKISILGDAAIKAAYVIFEDARPARDPRVGWAVKDL